MTLQRSVFVGCTSYAGADLNELIHHLTAWSRSTKETVERLGSLRMEVENKRARLDDADDILVFVDKMTDRFSRYGRDFERLIEELPRSVERRHLDLVLEMANGSNDLTDTCLVFKRRHIERPLKDETLRVQLIDQIYAEARGQAEDYLDLSNLLSRLKTFLGTQSGIDIPSIDYLELKPNIFGLGVNLNHILTKLARWWRRRGLLRGSATLKESGR